MKKILFSVAMLSMMAVSCDTTNNDEPTVDSGIRTLTFEDADYTAGANYIGEYSWSSLIDDAQYGGTLLYAAWAGVTTPYEWTDTDNTYLHNEILDTWGMGTYEFWNGGIAVSNYYAEVVSGLDYYSQLSVPCLDASTSGSGNNGSENFAIVNADVWSPTSLTFSDGISRVIDHLYIANTSYALSVCTYGDYSATALGATDTFWVDITGYDADGVVTEATTFFLATNGTPLEGWNKCDLSSLGEVASISFSINSTVQNDYGSVIPSYIAIDDIAVQF